MGTINQVIERGCTMLVHFDKSASSKEIKESLETGSNYEKADAMKKVISLLMNGEHLPQIFITIVRYVLPSEDHLVQKLLLLYMEIIEKTDSEGKLLPEMILICQNLRNNLQHPNEFIRGSTLRFLCRLSDPELIEPLVPSIVQNLEHRHPYVRRNAVMAIHKIYTETPRGEIMIQDAPEIIEQLLNGGESDLSTRRNAFLMLYHSDQDRAVQYLMANLESVANWGDILQTVVLDLIRKVCRTDPSQKGKYIKIILMLLQTNNTSVIYECANTLIALSNAPTAIKAAANCYCQLIVSQGDNNVKLIVLDRLADLKKNHREVMQDMVMDILRAVASPSVDIRRKTLDIVLDLINSRNIEEVVTALKKEIIKSQNDTGLGANEKNAEYRQMLVQSVHACAVKFPDVAGSVVHMLMDFLGDPNTASALDVIMFIREIAQTNSGMRESILQRLLDSFYSIRSSRVCATALWIIGEYSESREQVEEALATLKSSLGQTPFFEPPSDEQFVDDADEEKETYESGSVRPIVLADGTYATQTAVDTANVGTSTPNLRALLLSGDFFLAAICGGTMTKLGLRYMKSNTFSEEEKNRTQAEVMLYIVAMLRLGKSHVVAHEMDYDSTERLSQCFAAIESPDSETTQAWLENCRESFSKMINEKLENDAKEREKKEEKPKSQADDLIDFYHLKSRKGLSQVELEDAVATDLRRATGFNDPDSASNARDSKLNRVLQLTGFSDPVYAESYITVHQYDIVMDVTATNRTNEVLQNVCLELATMGDLKLVERPQNYTLAPGESKHIRANIKVSSTETGVIFGNIVYESRNEDRNVVVLNDIHIDIMDYIAPASCADIAFRNMWAEFEWENKVAVNTKFTDVKEYLDHVVKSTNMKCLTPESALDGECGFLAANVYARSVFGEDALVNVSVEKDKDEKLGGYIRIRSKTQGIALSLGDKITLKQRGPDK